MVHGDLPAPTLTLSLDCNVARRKKAQALFVASTQNPDLLNGSEVNIHSTNSIAKYLERKQRGLGSFDYPSGGDSVEPLKDLLARNGRGNQQ